MTALPYKATKEAFLNAVIDGDSEEVLKIVNTAYLFYKKGCQQKDRTTLKVTSPRAIRYNEDDFSPDMHLTDWLRKAVALTKSKGYLWELFTFERVNFSTPFRPDPKSLYYAHKMGHKTVYIEWWLTTQAFSGVIGENYPHYSLNPQRESILGPILKTQSYQART